MAMAMAAAAATSTVAMAQKAIQAEHHSSYAASSPSALGVRRISVNACELRSHFIVSRIGASTSRRPFVIAATAGEISSGDEESEEIAGLLEPPPASIDEEYVEALDNGTLGTGSDEKEGEEDEGEDVEDLKQQLIDSLYGTQRGLRASSDTRAEVVELITQLEARNPTPAPTEALTLLNGKWILAYTSYSELYPLLAAGNLPLVKVGEISQTIDALAFMVENSVSFEGPLTTTSFSTSASFEVRSPKRVQIKFEEGVIGTPKLTDSLEVPSSVDVMGQKIDLTPIRGLLEPLQNAAISVARTISGQPPLKFPIQADRAQSWLLTTYLDEDIRISRGDGGSVFVLLREGSALLY